PFPISLKWEAHRTPSTSRPSTSAPGSTGSSWTDSEIRVFLLEWEVVEQEMGHPGRKIHKKTRALCRRLYQQGLKKSWESCFDLLLSLRDLHRTLCNERPGIEPLFSPYAEALYRILGSSPQGSHVPGPLDDGAGNPPLSVYPQTPRNQPWDYGVAVPSAQLQGNALPMMSQEDSLFPRGEHWNPNHSMSAPNLLPDFAPGDPSFQQPWPTAE
ncbi:cDNA sequence BC049762, isoform CRA_a, partial [Mus musculus]